MTEEKYTAEQLEQMADQLLQENAPAQEKPAKGGLDEKTIASLPAAALLNGNEKLRDLFTKGKKKGKLDAGELSDVLDELDLESEQMDSIYDSLEQLGIEVGSEDFLADLPDEDGEPAMDEIAEIEEEELVDPNSLVDSFNALRESGLNADQIKRQVGELVKTVEDPSLLQETLIAVVTGSMGSGQTEWGMNVITDALRDRESLEDLIVRSLLRLRKEGGAARSNDFVQQMLAYMNAHYADEALSLQYIADNVVYMNADYIGREFTRSVGQKFSSQLLSIRMEHAKLLIRSDPSLHSYEIAEKVGLGENPHYFSQLFRKYTGMTPKDYRKQLDEQTGQG